MTIFIPIEPNGKRPLVSGWSEASPAQAEEWESGLDSNTAIRCDDYVVIDCDTDEARLWWESQPGYANGPLHTPVQVKTPHGWHYYYRLNTLPGGVVAPQAGALRAPDGTPLRVDVKTGHKHYVLCPPSVVDGTPYAYVGPGIKDAPVWPLEGYEALEAVRGQVRQQATPGTTGDGLEAFPEGMRHEMLVQNVGLWRRQGWGDEMIGRVLNGLNQSLMNGDPLPEAEILGIIQSTSAWEAEEATKIELEPDEVPETENPPILLSGFMKLPPPQEWLWHPYLPLGRVTLVDGYEGIGKGMLSAYAAVQVTSGAWGPKAPVLWLSTEDDPEEDIYRRLLAAGHEYPAHDHIHFINPDLFVGFPEHIETIEAYVRKHGIRLIILDPGREYLTPPDGVKRSFNDEAAIRKPLQAIQRMAVRTKCAVMFLHHWNKDSEGRTRTRAGGSGAFVQVVRHRVTLYKAGEGDLAEWAMAVTKSNILNDNALREYRLAAAPEYDTALLEMGERIKDFPSGDAWMKARSNELDNPTCGPPDSEIIEFHLASHLVPGTMMPHRSVVAEWTGLSERRVRAAMEEIEAEGRIEMQPGNRRVWKG